MATLKSADAEAIHIKAQRDAKGHNEESGCRGYTNQGRKGMRRATIKRTNAEAIHIKGAKGCQGHNEESGCRCYTNQKRRGIMRATIKRVYAEAIQIKRLQRDEKDDNKESGSRARRATIKRERADAEAMQMKVAKG